MARLPPHPRRSELLAGFRGSRGGKTASKNTRKVGLPQQYELRQARHNNRVPYQPLRTLAWTSDIPPLARPGCQNHTCKTHTVAKLARRMLHYTSFAQTRITIIPWKTHEFKKNGTSGYHPFQVYRQIMPEHPLQDLCQYHPSPHMPRHLSQDSCYTTLCNIHSIQYTIACKTHTIPSPCNYLVTVYTPRACHTVCDA